MAYTLPELGYAYDALEPHIDAKTMEIHHTKHHQTYITNVNAALEGTEFADKDILEVISNLDALPADKQAAVRNNGGGHANHTLFWEVIAPGGSNEPVGEVKAAIEAKFGSFEAFKEAFAAAGTTRFGSGWAWLIVDGDGVAVTSTPYQDSPVMEGKTPILGLDVWEHAYYLNYQNRRPDYIAAFWNVVNWDVVEAKFQAAK
jgi:superoxide dismutase, Fe-Mn family